MDVTSAGNVLGKEDFLKLLTVQLRHQDPLNPMDGTDFTAQLAQFSSLEELFNIDKNIQDLLSYQTSINNGIVTGLLGKAVTLGDGSTQRVAGITFDEGGTSLLLDNDEKILLSDIQAIYEDVPGDITEEETGKEV